MFAFVEDVAASGGYMIACAADEIFADPASLVGSIGVISAGSGSTGCWSAPASSAGCTRPAATRRCSIPSGPEQPEDVERLKAIQERVHATFRVSSTDRRGARLRATRNLFSGAVWAGGAPECGLVDAPRRRAGHVARAVRRQGASSSGPDRAADAARALFRRSTPAAGDLGLGAALAAIEERAAWARWGL